MSSGHLQIESIHQPPVSKSIDESISQELLNMGRIAVPIQCTGLRISMASVHNTHLPALKRVPTVERRVSRGCFDFSRPAL